MIEETIRTVLAGITILPEFRDWALEVLRENNEQEVNVRTSIQETQTKSLLSTQKELDNLTKMWLRDLLSDEEYIEQKESLVGEINKTRELLHDTEERADKWLELTEKTFDFATYAQYNFDHGDFETRREIFTTLGSTFTLKNKNLNIHLNEWLVPIQENYPLIESELQEVRTNKSMSLKEKTAALTTVRSHWLRGPDSNRRPIGYTLSLYFHTGVDYLIILYK